MMQICGHWCVKAAKTSLFIQKCPQFSHKLSASNACMHAWVFFHVCVEHSFQMQLPNLYKIIAILHMHKHTKLLFPQIQKTLVGEDDTSKTIFLFNWKTEIQSVTFVNISKIIDHFRPWRVSGGGPFFTKGPLKPKDAVYALV